jgi:flagellar protein FliS
MLASLHSLPGSSAQMFSNLYRQVGVQSAVAGGASPHRLIAMLFDGALEAIAQARGALREGRLEDKGRAIGRAVRIVEEGLKAGLDRQAGGPLAAHLSDLYAYLGMRLTQANLRNDEAVLLECQRLIEPLRDAWAQIGAQTPAQ